MNATRKVKLKDLTENLTCHLCKGYFIDASTIIECLHSFCRACIVKHLEKSEFCPVCDVQLHSSKPLTSVRSDQMLQEIVYKLVPGLFQGEMAKRRHFYKENTSSVPMGKRDSGHVYNETYITSEDQIQLSLEYYTSDSKFRESTKRYIQCPAAVSISILKKFIQGKYDLNDSIQINVMYGDRILPDDFLLMDIAYKYSWTQNGNKPLQLCYTVQGGPVFSPPKISASKKKSDQCPSSTPVANRNKRRTSMNSNKTKIETPTPVKLPKGMNGCIRIPDPIRATASPLPKKEISKKAGRKGKLVNTSTTDNSSEGVLTLDKHDFPVQNGGECMEVQSDALNLSKRPSSEGTSATGTEVQLRISENGVMSARSIFSGEEKIINSSATKTSPLKGESVYPLNGISSRPIDMLLNGGSRVENVTKLKRKRNCKPSGQSPKVKKICKEEEISQDKPAKSQKTPKQKKKNGILPSCTSSSSLPTLSNGQPSPAQRDEIISGVQNRDVSPDLLSDFRKAPTSARAGINVTNEDANNKRFSLSFNNGSSADPFVTPSKICNGTPSPKKPPKFFKSRHAESVEPDSQITPVKTNGNTKYDSTNGIDSPAKPEEPNSIEISHPEPVITPISTHVHMFNGMNSNAVYGFPMGCGNVHQNMAMNMNIGIPGMNLMPLMTSNYCSMPLSVFHNPRTTMSAWANTFTVPSQALQYQNPVQLNQLDLSTKKPVSNCVHIVPKKPEKIDNGLPPSQKEPLSLKVNKSPKRKVDSPRKIISSPGGNSRKTPIKIPKVIPQHIHPNGEVEKADKPNPLVNRNMNNNIGEDGVIDKNEVNPSNGLPLPLPHTDAEETKGEIIDLASNAAADVTNDNGNNDSVKDSESEVKATASDDKVGDSTVKDSESNDKTDGSNSKDEDSNARAEEASSKDSVSTAKDIEPVAKTDDANNEEVKAKDPEKEPNMPAPNPEKSENDIELAKEPSAPVSPKSNSVIDCVSNSDSENNNGEENGNAEKVLYIAESEEIANPPPAALSAHINDTPSVTATTPLDRG